MTDLIPVQQALELGTEKMAEDAFEGVKCVSIRPGHRDYTEGGVLVLYYWGTVDDPTSATIRASITSVRHCTIGDVPEQDWRDDGFTSPDDLLAGLNVFYDGKLTFESPATVIRWDGLHGPHVEAYHRWRAEESGD